MGKYVKMTNNVFVLKIITGVRHYDYLHHGHSASIKEAILHRINKRREL